MIGVDLIGQIRRAYFDQHRPIKEIVRTLSVSRATVRKVVRVLRDNLDENGASIWMRRGGRADRQLTMVVVLARLRLTRSVNQLRRSPFS